MSAFVTRLLWSVCFILLLSQSVNAEESFKSVLEGYDTDRAKAMLAKDPLLLEKDIQFDSGASPMSPLLYAISRKNYAMMKVLIDAGADVSAANFEVVANRDETPLALAAELNDLAGLRLLLDSGTTNKIQKAITLHGSSAMTIAAALGHQRIIEELLSRGVSVNDGDVLGRAVGSQRWKLVKFLLSRGADPKREYLFANATESAPLEVIKMMLEHGADPNAQGSYRTALTGACNDIQKVKLLVAAGADVNGSVRNGDRPLHYAAFWGNLEVVDFLLSKNAEVNVKEGYGKTPLNLAIRRGHFEIVKTLLDAGADPTLHAEVALGDLDEVKHALVNGVDVNLAMVGDNTPEYAPRLIHTAITFERDKVLKLLLDKGANVEAKIGDVSALHQAVTQKSLELTKLLLDHGADPNVAFDEGRYGTGSLTPLHILAGARINSQVDKETTNLEDQQTEIAIAKLLLKSGANKDLQSEMGQTALQLAEQYRKHLVPLLKEKAAEETE